MAATIAVALLLDRVEHRDALFLDPCSSAWVCAPSVPSNVSRKPVMSLIDVTIESMRLVHALFEQRVRQVLRLPARLDGHLHGENRHPIAQVAQGFLHAADRLEAAVRSPRDQRGEVRARRRANEELPFDGVLVHPSQRTTSCIRSNSCRT